MIDIAKLLVELDDVTSWDARTVTHGHMHSLCKQSAAAIRQLQAANTRDMMDAHATFLLQLGDGISTLGKRIQNGA